MFDDDIGRAGRNDVLRYWIRESTKEDIVRVSADQGAEVAELQTGAASKRTPHLSRNFLNVCRKRHRGSVVSSCWQLEKVCGRGNSVRETRVMYAQTITAETTRCIRIDNKKGIPCLGESPGGHLQK